MATSDIKIVFWDETAPWTGDLKALAIQMVGLYMSAQENNDFWAYLDEAGNKDIVVEMINDKTFTISLENNEITRRYYPFDRQIELQKFKTALDEVFFGWLYDLGKWGLKIIDWFINKFKR